jgi:hypothetical protein
VLSLRRNPWPLVPVWFVLFVVLGLIGGDSWDGAVVLALIATAVTSVVLLIFLRVLTGRPRRS